MPLARIRTIFTGITAPHLTSTMLVLIVGITGNLGLKITGALHARGHKVRGAARNPKNIPEAQFKSLEGFYQLSAWYDADSLRKALKGVDAVICAYTPTPSLALEGELLLVRLMEEEGIKVSNPQSVAAAPH